MGPGPATVTRMGRLWPARTRQRPRKASTVVRRARRPAPIRFAKPRRAPRVRALPAALAAGIGRARAARRRAPLDRPGRAAPSWPRAVELRDRGVVGAAR